MSSVTSHTLLLAARTYIFQVGILNAGDHSTPSRLQDMIGSTRHQNVVLTTFLYLYMRKIYVLVRDTEGMCARCQHPPLPVLVPATTRD